MIFWGKHTFISGLVHLNSHPSQLQLWKYRLIILKLPMNVSLPSKIIAGKNVNTSQTNIVVLFRISLFSRLLFCYLSVAVSYPSAFSFLPTPSASLISCYHSCPASCRQPHFLGGIVAENVIVQKMFEILSVGLAFIMQKCSGMLEVTMAGSWI